MPDVRTTLLLNGTNTGVPTQKLNYAQPATEAVKFYTVDVRNSSTMSLSAQCTAGTTGLVFTIEVTTDPLGLTGYAAAASRAPGGGAYAATAITVAPNAFTSRFFDPTDNVSWIRLNVTTNDGTNALVNLTQEI